MVAKLRGGAEGVDDGVEWLVGTEKSDVWEGDDAEEGKGRVGCGKSGGFWLLLKRAIKRAPPPVMFELGEDMSCGDGGVAA